MASLVLKRQARREYEMEGAQLYVAIRNGEMPDWMIVDICPSCGENSYTVECQHCGADIAGLEEAENKREAERYAQDCKEWEGV
jgi:hypothetical protein